MNLVTMTGVLKDKIDDTFRELEYDAPFTESNNHETMRIKTIYWTRQSGNRLINLSSGTRVLIHGHLEAHKIFGTILLAEELEVIG